ncbi:MAG: hypothetical protein KME69_03600 [Candidatus Thiodiazotropha sp. (ex Codakia orbicularis)]|nr:hypothetical protein [Candidatus Thiodiazotropha sp. (ex Codakia orbicularis)]
MRKIVRLQLAVLVITLILINPLNAAPRVVVSPPELHSLVAALMQGAAEPILLFQSESDRSRDLDPFQTSAAERYLDNVIALLKKIKNRARHF